MLNFERFLTLHSTATYSKYVAWDNIHTVSCIVVNSHLFVTEMPKPTDRTSPLYLLWFLFDERICCNVCESFGAPLLPHLLCIVLLRVYYAIGYSHKGKLSQPRHKKQTHHHRSATNLVGPVYSFKSLRSR